MSVAVDASNNVYVADTNNHRIQMFTGDGTFLGKWGTEGTGNSQFEFPGEVATHFFDVYVGDLNNSRVQKFGPTTSITHTITATAGPGGQITPSGTVLVGDGVDVTIFFYPDPGYRVDTVTVDGVPQVPDSSNLYVFHSVSSDHTIQVTFALLSPPPPPPPVAIEVNRIRMLITPAGWFAMDPRTLSAGLEFPKGSGKTMVFASGLWLGALVAGETRVSMIEYTDEFQPGAIVNGVADDPNRPEYHVFRLERHYDSAAVRDSALLDYNSGAVPHGAPPVTLLPSGDLDILGDEMLWHVYNDANPVNHTNQAGSTAPLGVEIQQTAYAFDRAGALGNTVFLKFKITNKGGNVLAPLVAGLWSDPDLGGFTDDLVGSDPSRGLGYCYNATNNDAVYGSSPPAIGCDLLAVTGGSGPPAGAASFNQYLNGEDPQSATESFNLMQGRLRDGSPIFNPVTQQPTHYFYDGDPVIGTGWLDSNPSDRRFLLGSGSYSLAPGESLEVDVAIVIGDGTDRLSSIRKLRTFDDQVQAFFDGAAACQVAILLDLSPDVLNLRSMGHWVTALLEPPAPLMAEQIDVASIRLNGTVPVDPGAPVNFGDSDHDGIQELQVKFDRAALELTLSQGDGVPVEVTGTVADQSFCGSESIRVLRAVVTSPDSDSVLSPGINPVTWEMPDGVNIETVGILLSLDDGATWQLVANGVPNSGRYDWLVPDISAQLARVAIVVAATTPSGFQVEDVIGVSDRFSIQRVTGVGRGQTASFALGGVSPNPARDAFYVSLSLRDGAPAKLEMFDVSGRHVLDRRVEGLGAGWHRLRIGDEARLPAGLYIIRVTQQGNSLVTRVVIAR
jgi:NHL repeat